MSDGKLFIFDYGADIKIALGDLVPDAGLYTAVLISLFTDKRAPADAELPDPAQGRRGWWPDTETQKIGSHLWLLNREKTLEEVAARAKEYTEAALKWLTDEGIAARVLVETLIVRPFGLQIRIEIRRGAARKYDYLWKGVAESEQLQAGETTVQLKFVQ